MFNIANLTKIEAINSKTNKTEIYNLNNLMTIIEMAAYTKDNQLSNLTFKTILEYGGVAENTELTAVDDAEIKATIKSINQTYQSLVNYDEEVQISKCYENSFYCYLHDIITGHISNYSIFEITIEDLIKLEDPLLKLYNDMLTTINITADSTTSEVNEVLTDLDENYYIEDPSELVNLCIEANWGANWGYAYDRMFYIIDLLNIDFTVEDFIDYCEEETVFDTIVY